MTVIDRNSPEDAETFCKKLLPDTEQRLAALRLLASAIRHAHARNPGNWNLNVDKGRQFIRFNVGQEFCITLYKEELLIITMRESLEHIRDISPEIRFQGYQQSPDKKTVTGTDLTTMPDVLKRVPGSIGCLIQAKNLVNTLPHLEIPNRLFIDHAISRTQLLPGSKQAHSPGFLIWLQDTLDPEIPHPAYATGPGKTDTEKTDEPWFQPGPPPSGTTAILPSRQQDSQTIALRHADLQRALHARLCEEHGQENVGHEHDPGGSERTRIDTIVRKGPDEYWYYEIKTSACIRTCIREALGQILEYAYWPGAQEPTRLFIAGEPELTPEASAYLENLGRRFDLKIGYEQITLPESQQQEEVERPG